MHISSSYAKILVEKLFHTWEIPQSWSKAEDGGKKKRREKERGAKVGDNNGQATHGACKHAWRTQAAWANIASALIVVVLKTLSSPSFRPPCFSTQADTQHCPA